MATRPSNGEQSGMSTKYLNDQKSALREHDVEEGVPQSVEVWKRTVPVGRYQVEPDRSHAEFVTRMFKIYPVEGRFDAIRGHIELRESIERSSLDIVIDADSVDTGISLRDRSLRSAFLDTDQHPEIRFVAEHLQPLGKNTYAAHGHLTVRGTTEPAVFHVTLTDTFFQRDATFARLVATADIDRRAFDVPEQEALVLGGLVVDPTVRVQVDITACIAER